MAKPFESRIQDLVYNVDVGIGHRIIKVALYFLFIFSVMLIYTATQFRGLKDPVSMDQAQLGRNMMQHGRLITQYVRPASMWYLIEKSPRSDPRVDAHPDIVHAPVYPAMLAGWFRLTRAGFPTEIEGRRVYPADNNVVWMNNLFALLTGLLLFLIARRIFDGRVALLGVTIYFLSDVVWAESISGTGRSILTFWATAAFYTALVAVSNVEEGKPFRRWLVPMVFSLIFCVLAFLTRYGAVVLVPGLALFYGVALGGRRGGIWAMVFIAAFLIGISPWLARNRIISGGLLGLAPYTALNQTEAFEADTFERSLAPEIDFETAWTSLQPKFINNVKTFYSENVRLLGDGLLGALFLVTFFYRFIRRPVHLFRWALAVSILLLMFLGGLFGDETMKLINMFWPIVILYGLAFFMILLDRLQLEVRILNIGVIAALVILSALPIVFTFLPPRASLPYPPYYPPFIMRVSNLLQPGELMCSDMPWATAWYGNRNTLHLPVTLDEFYDVNDFVRPVRGLYLTHVSRDQPYLRGFRTGRHRSWYMIQQLQIPGDFPLTQGFTLPPQQLDQVFLTDRQRWLD